MDGYIRWKEESRDVEGNKKGWLVVWLYYYIVYCCIVYMYFFFGLVF